MIGLGDFGERRKLGIVSTDDERLVLIDPTSEGFFENVLGFNTDNQDIKEFIEAIEGVKEAKVQPFWKPIYDPSLDDGEVIFKAGNVPAVDYSFNFWKQQAEKMPTVDGKKWGIGTEDQYYAFLVWLVNSLIERGWTIKDSLSAVVLDSKELGHYEDSENAKHDFEATGSREVCGVYDLANAFKYLVSTDKNCTLLGAGGACREHGDTSPLASLLYLRSKDSCYINVIGWLVLA